MGEIILPAWQLRLIELYLLFNVLWWVRWGVGEWRKLKALGTGR